MLRLAWENSTALPEVTARLGVDEVQVVRRLMALGIATDTLAVTDRLGCSPRGYVDVQRRLAADRAAARVWVLVIHDLGAEPMHQSLHPTRDAAVTARDTFIAANVDEPQASGPWWCIAERAPASDGGYTEVSD